MDLIEALDPGLGDLSALDGGLGGGLEGGLSFRRDLDGGRGGGVGHQLEPFLGGSCGGRSKLMVLLADARGAKCNECAIICKGY